MNFNKHSNLEGLHAFLSASRYHWLNYSEETLRQNYLGYKATQMGTKLHTIAAEMIKLGIKPRKTKKTFDMYVNDAIGYKMIPEQPLYYSENCFGTADAISFRNNLLRIHDLKTGKTTASIKQLYIYAALFCLEYDIKPGSIDIELRIYQNNEVLIDNPTAEDILPIMDKIIKFDKIIQKMKEEE